jgi:hypothetical protein
VQHLDEHRSELLRIDGGLEEVAHSGFFWGVPVHAYWSHVLE